MVRCLALFSLLFACDGLRKNEAFICNDASADPMCAVADAGPPATDLAVLEPPPYAPAPVDPDAGPGAPGSDRTCRPPALPRGQIRFVDALPALRFERPLWVGHDGASDKLYVVEKCRGIRVVDNGAAAEFLRLEPACRSEQGVLGLAFHPGYARNGRLFVYYSLEQPLRSIVSEFRAEDGRVDRASERVMLEVEQPFRNHNGGDLHFGPDGYLYIALGDGGSGGDPRRNGQRPSTLLGSMLRVDVDGPEPYGIPPDNPFATCAQVCGDGAVARPEVWAWGLRNPWRFSFDRANGELWAGDVGQDRREEIDVVVGGGNYGWNLREGLACFEADACRDDGLVPPVHSYGRGEGQSVTGGYVYRGPDLPELYGAYIFGDYETGRVWSFRRGDEDARLLADTDVAISSFGEDRAGRLHVASYDDGRILRIARAEESDTPLARTLSATGCFVDTAAHTFSADVEPYGLPVALWSDGATKRRGVAVPEGGEVGDEGTVLVKTFERDGRRLETRLLVHQPTGWQGLSYRWRDDQSDADLLDDALDADEWHFPSRAECDACHTAAAGHTLGLPARDWPRLDDDAAPVEIRARAYLHVNCANCHRPGGVAAAELDLRFEADGCEVPDKVLQAMLRRDMPGAMPPLGSARVDPTGTNIVAQWLRSRDCMR